MGQTVSAGSASEPDKHQPPTFAPDLGFPNGRKERVMQVTELEMEAAKMPLKYRDFCAHLLMDVYVCRKREYPLVYRCEHEYHKHAECQYQDYILRMKEYEREKRLMEREQRKAALSK